MLQRGDMFPGVTMFKSVLLAAAIFAAPFSAAQAASLDAVDLLQQFNLITKGDVQANSLHVHGRALIGGGLTGNKVDVNMDNIDTIVASDFDDLIVGNATSGTKVHLHNGATASMNGTPGLVEAGSYTTPAVMPDDYAAILDDFSAQLAGIDATAMAVKNSDGNLITFGAAASGGTTYYDIVAADLMNRDIDLLLNGAESIVINVTGTGTFNLNSNFRGNKAVSANVIWNFTGFDTVNLYRSIWGQVLAGDSHVYFNADIEGSLFADTVTAQAQVHVQPLQFTPPVSQVPLPAGAWFMLAGFGAFGALRARRARG